MPTLIAGAVAVLVLYLLLQMYRAANRRLHRLSWRACCRYPDRHLRRRLAWLVAVRNRGFWQYRRDFLGPRFQALIGTELAGPLPISRYDARSRQRRAFGADHLWTPWRAPTGRIRSR